jgi:superfamily II DNA helicase RecQ
MSADAPVVLDSDSEELAPAASPASEPVVLDEDSDEELAPEPERATPPGDGGWAAAAATKLRHHWGHGELRSSQREAIGAAIAGRDVLVVLATGTGKSVCYQLPPLIVGRPCLVISPLIALMQDQVQALRTRGIAAAVIGSGAQEHADDYQKALRGEFALIYMPPEAVDAELLRKLAAPPCRLCLLAVDEAHCAVEWGHDFRPTYARIGGLRPPGLPLMALTATAPEPLRSQVRASLRLSTSACVVTGSLARPNLFYEVREKRGDALHDVLPLVRDAVATGWAPTRTHTQRWLQPAPTRSAGSNPHPHAAARSLTHTQRWRDPGPRESDADAHPVVEPSVC